MAGASGGGGGFALRSMHRFFEYCSLCLARTATSDEVRRIPESTRIASAMRARRCKQRPIREKVRGSGRGATGREKKLGGVKGRGCNSELILYGNLHATQRNS
jgi:hypothetical protein